MISKLPSSLFLLLRDFLFLPYANDFDSWRNLLSTNKWFYHEIKRNYDIYKFSGPGSLLYITLHNPLSWIGDSSLYDKMTRICQLICASSQQVVLTFPFDLCYLYESGAILITEVVSQWLNMHLNLFYEIYGLRIASIFLNSDTGISTLTSLPTMFSFFADIPCDLSLFTHCKRVFLEDKSTLKCDLNGQILVPPVNTIVELDLPDCNSICQHASFICHLPFLRKLNLSVCQSLSDVSHLGNIYDLNLSVVNKFVMFLVLDNKINEFLIFLVVL
jgi:hypothetical protein